MVGERRRIIIMNKRLLKKVIVIKAHAIALVILFLTFLPIGKWYMDHHPLYGVDFSLTTSMAKQISENPVMPHAFWNYAGFDGWPYARYPFLIAYLTAFAQNFFDLFYSAQILMMASVVLFGFGCYFLFYKLSRNIILSLGLAIFVLWSGGVYQTLTWAGSLPSFATQAAVPWVLYFLVGYLKEKNIKSLLTASLIAGISILSHPLPFMVYIVPSAMILIFTRFDKDISFIKKIKTAAIFLGLAFIIGLPLLLPTFRSSLKSAVQTDYGIKALSTTAAPTQTDIDLKKFNEQQFYRIVTDNHPGPIILSGILGALFLISLLASRRKNSIIKIFPWITLVGYFVFYIWLFGKGISIYHGGWYRLYWSVPVWVGALAAVLWRQTELNLRYLVKKPKLKYFIHGALNTPLVIVILLLLGIYPTTKVIDMIAYRSETSSAHPDVVNLRIKDNERLALKSKFTPSWFNGDETNWRLYTGDQTVNIWWSNMFKMPLARGYIDPPLDSFQRGYIFWLDAALSEGNGKPQLVESFKYPLETTLSNALFLLDWNAIKFYEGGHIGAVFKPVPQYLQQLVVKREEKVTFDEERYTKHPVFLNYVEFKDELVSPIMAATDASTIGIFASDGGYETVVRAIAEKDNINSQKLIPLKLGRFVDKLSLSDLKNFDSLYLYDYDYSSENNAFQVLNEYLKTGKKIFIETGVETKQSEGALSDFFPISKAERKGLGKDWQLQDGGLAFTQGVDLSQFSPPIFDEAEWKMSYAQSDNLRPGAQVILKNKDKIVMASQKIGGGEVIWSGLNFAYHLTRNHNQEEAKMFVKLLSYTNDLSLKPVPTSSVRFINANRRLIKLESAKGVLFKEQAYPGWSVGLQSAGESNGFRSKIYKAGPAYPGFMYVPTSSLKNAELDFRFGGSITDKLSVFISGLVILFILDEVALRGIFLGRLRKTIWAQARKRTGLWWSKEE